MVIRRRSSRGSWAVIPAAVSDTQRRCRRVIPGRVHTWPKTSSMAAPWLDTHTAAALASAALAAIGLAAQLSDDNSLAVTGSKTAEVDSRRPTAGAGLSLPSSRAS